MAALPPILSKCCRPETSSSVSNSSDFPSSRKKLCKQTVAKICKSR